MSMMRNFGVRNVRTLLLNTRGGYSSYFRTSASETQAVKDVGKDETSVLAQKPEKSPDGSEKQTSSQVKPKNLRFSHLADYRFVYPEFLPDPRFEFRHKIREKLERSDMLKRRTVIDIPEFYVGSVLAVTYSDPHSPGKVGRFVGICIHRTYIGLRSTLTLRNVIDKQGVEMMFDMYNPTMQGIDVLKLEKRLDDELFYLRDAPHEYSTFPLDMDAEFIIEGEPVRVNPIKVPLNPRPWCARWERYTFRGVIYPKLPQKVWEKAKKSISPPPEDKYDLMKEYRRCIPEEDQLEIWQDFDAHKQYFQHKKQLWKQKAVQK